MHCIFLPQKWIRRQQVKLSVLSFRETYKFSKKNLTLLEALPRTIKTKLITSCPKIWQKIVFHSNKDVFTRLKLLFNHLKERKEHAFASFTKSTRCLHVSKLMRRSQIMVQYSTCFQFYALPFKAIYLKLRKMQFNHQGVAHNPVPRIENIDSRIV